MDGTIKLPAIGEVKKQYVYVGAAIVTVIVGYAYWRRASGLEQADVTEEELAVDEGQYEPDYVDPTFGGVSSMPYTPPVATEVIDTNAEWTTAAVEAMAALSYDGATVAAALGKYLAKQALTPAQAEMVTTARGLVGEPPVGGPYAIIYAPGGGTTPPTTTPPTTTPPASTWKGPVKRKATWAGKGTGVNANTHVYPNLSSWDAVVGYYYENLPPYSGASTTRAQVASALQKFNSGKAMKPGMLVYLKATLP